MELIARATAHGIRSAALRARVRRPPAVASLVTATALGAMWFYADVLHPSPVALNYDPELAYLLNSLAVFKGYSYSFVEHPGTPVEVLGSVLLLLLWPVAFFSGTPFFAFVLRHTTLFLAVGHGLLVLLSAVAGTRLARTAAHGRIGSAYQLAAAFAAAGLFFAIHPDGFASLLNWSHNSFAFPVGTLLSVWLISLVGRERPITTRQMVLVGLAAGVFTTVQIFFAAWVVGAIVAIAARLWLELKDWRVVLRACLVVGIASLAGFVVATLPILPNYGRLLAFMFFVITRQGQYGSGDLGVTSPGRLAENVGQLFAALPVLTVLSAVVPLAAVLLLWWRQADRRLIAIGLGLALQLLAVFVVIAKHPGPNYMLAAAAMMPPLLVVLFRLWPSRLFIVAMASLVGLSCIWNLARTLTDHDRRVAQTIQANDEIGRKTSGRGLVLSTYGIDTLCQTLWFGDSWNAYAFGREISEICPDELTLNIWLDVVRLPNGDTVDVDQVPWAVIAISDGVLKSFPRIGRYGSQERLPITGANGQVILIYRGQ